MDYFGEKIYFNLTHSPLDNNEHPSPLVNDEQLHFPLANIEFPPHWLIMNTPLYPHWLIMKSLTPHIG